MTILIKILVQFLAIAPRVHLLGMDGTFMFVHMDSKRLGLTYILSMTVCTCDGVNQWLNSRQG